MTVYAGYICFILKLSDNNIALNVRMLSNLPVNKCFVLKILFFLIFQDFVICYLQIVLLLTTMPV